MLMGKPAIYSRYSGVYDFVKEDELVAPYDWWGYPVRCQETPVSGMPWNIYQGDMVWAEPDLMDARRQMRYVFEHRNEAQRQGQRGQELVKSRLSWQTIGEAMAKRLREIK
jgi:hypothetical protein